MNAEPLWQMFVSMSRWLTDEYGPVFESVAIAYARIAPVCMFLPFLNERIFAGGTVRHVLIAVIAMVLWPTIGEMTGTLPATSADLVWVTAHEAIAGLAIGVTLAAPFWICIAIGEYIDNQRGATISDVLDPAHGVEVSTLAALMSVFSGAAFLANDGMRVVIESLRLSYLSVGPYDGLTIDWVACARLLDHLLREALRLSAPVITTMFLTEIALGVLSRFASQMSAFSLAFSIKSVVALFVFELYFGTSMSRMFAVMTPLAHIPVLTK